MKRATTSFCIAILDVTALKFIIASPSEMLRRQQESCTPALGGCSGPGLWDEDQCQCLCIENYCYDIAAGTCSTFGACPNDFIGCTPKVNCPYFSNPAIGGCQTGPDVIAGVYELYWTEEECCNKAFSWDLESCITETKSPTGTPTILPPSGAPNKSKAGYALPQIPLRLVNMPDVEISNLQSSKMKDVIRLITEDEVNILNVVVTSVDIVDVVHSQERALMRKSSNNDEGVVDMPREHEKRSLLDVLTLMMEIRVGETTVLPDKLYSTILGALQMRKYEIDQVFRDIFGAEIYNNAILEIDGHSTTLAPAIIQHFNPQPDGSISPNKQNIRTTDDEGTNQNTSTLVFVILFGLLFAFVSFGLVLWQRKRDEKLELELKTQLNRYKKSLRRGKHKSLSGRKLHVSETTPRIANRPFVDEQENKTDKELMLGYFSENDEQSLIIDEFDKGYDGGRSSFLDSHGDMSNNSLNNISDLNLINDLEEESLGDNVLGLLYYAGASSAEEDEVGQSELVKNARLKHRSSNVSSRKSRASRGSMRSSISRKSKS